MRYLLLILVLPLAACGGFDCSFPDYETVKDNLVLGAETLPSDTLSVVFELEEFGGAFQNVWIGLEASTPNRSGSGRTELIMRAEYGDYEATGVPPLAIDVRGDTLVVQTEALMAAAPVCAKREGLVQPVCSPIPPRYDLFVLGINTPEAVRVVQYLSRDAQGRLAPMRSVASPRASASRAVRT